MPSKEDLDDSSSSCSSSDDDEVDRDSQSNGASMAASASSLGNQGLPRNKVFTFPDREAVGGKIEFFANFDSANLARVEQKDELTYWLWVAADAEGTLYCTTFRSWFYFGLRNVPYGRRLKFVIRNINKQGNLYRHQHRPVYRAVPSMPDWKHVRLRTTYDFDSVHGIVTFEHTFEDTKAKAVYFAHFFPFSYSDHKIALQAVERAFGNKAIMPHEDESLGVETGNRLERREDDFSSAKDSSSDIYFARELLTRTPEKREVDLITITSSKGAHGQREEKYHRPGLFPDFGRVVGKEYMTDQSPAQDVNEPGDPYSGFSLSPASFARKLEVAAEIQSDGNEFRITRPHSFPDKPVVFISSRVHPGETPASFVLNGILRFLLNETNEAAKMLRQAFVFKIIPMLNPDGVATGHYRADCYGENLNRLYLSPDPNQAPSIYAAKCILEETRKQERLFLYLDLHAHASKRGCFFYGNHLSDPVDQLFNTLFPRFVSLYSPHVDLFGNNFSEKNMKARDKRDKAGSSKEGAGRVGIYNVTGCVLCYTLECNYNTDARPSRLSGMENTQAAKSYQSDALETWRYTPASWENVGIATLLGLLDLVRCNPASRLETSEWKTYRGAQKSALRRLCAQNEYKEGAQNLLQDSARMKNEASSIPTFSPLMENTLNADVFEHLKGCSQQVPAKAGSSSSVFSGKNSSSRGRASKVRPALRTLSRASSFSSTSSKTSMSTGSANACKGLGDKKALPSSVLQFPPTDAKSVIEKPGLTTLQRQQRAGVLLTTRQTKCDVPTRPTSFLAKPKSTSSMTGSKSRLVSKPNVNIFFASGSK
eukprot:gb/GECG01005561.1/.p1 GENE.gb/GECG01005561.1/~~gb/GECG01005561.1/.p1  ORF type:complete len:823 (+),score=76.98 gb/GECG01005561.1/:1-2469(+)